jgi:asparagine synthase (glutamine-hydrolysing)
MTADATAAVTGDRLAWSAFDPRARIAGWIDAAALTQGAEPIAVRTEAGTALLTALGLGVAVDAARVRWHCERRSVTLVIGQPRLGDVAANAAAIHDLLASGIPDGAIRLRDRYAVVHLDADRGFAALATDRFAVHPLCWSLEGTRFSFADRADCVPIIGDRLIDPQAVFNYTYFHVIPAPRTIFRGVQRLGASTALEYSARGVQTAVTWEPRFAPHQRTAGAALGERFRSLILDAVRREADGAAAGAFLSGGTDSSTVAGMLCKVLDKPAPTFSIGFDAAGYDEIAYARIAAKHFGTDHHEYYVTPADLCAGIPQVASHYDQPFGNSSAVPAYYCARLAAEHGVLKLLAGDGGDELFGGNSRYAKQKLFEAYWALPGALRAHVAERFLLSEPVRRLPGLSKAASYVSQARSPMPARTETYNLLARFGVANVFTQRFLDGINPEEPAHLQAAVYACHPHAAFVDRMLAFDWRFTLADNDLPKVVGTARLAGEEVGFPLLSDALVDLSLQLSARDKVRGQKLRHFFKEALADFLPREILRKKKHGFGLPVGPWLVSDVAFNRLARASLDNLADRGVLQAPLVEDLFSIRLGEHAGYYGEMVWVLMMLEQWLCAQAPRFAVR